MLANEAVWYPSLVQGMLVLAVVTFGVLFFVSASYGRHAREGWGPVIPATLGWVLMESPSSLVFAALWAVGDPARRDALPGLACLVLWQAHYLHRAFVFPFRRRGGVATMPLVIALMAILFNLLNAWINARWLYTLGPVRDASWLLTAPFWIGLILFVAGFCINQHADHILFSLRKPGETGYRIPYGGLYRYVSCPNYLGELVEWGGFALLSFSPGGLAFFVWTAANLLPRAWTHHRWYQEKFPEYPRERKAVIPFLF